MNSKKYGENIGAQKYRRTKALMLPLFWRNDKSASVKCARPVRDGARTTSWPYQRTDWRFDTRTRSQDNDSHVVIQKKYFSPGVLHDILAQVLNQERNIDWTAILILKWNVQFVNPLVGEEHLEAPAAIRWFERAHRMNWGRITHVNSTVTGIELDAILNVGWCVARQE